MALYSINTTAQQETFLDAFLVLFNQRRVAQGLPTLTKAQLVDLFFQNGARESSELVRARRVQSIKSKLEDTNTTDATVIQVRDLLALSDSL